MQHYRNNPDEPIRHDWLAGAIPAGCAIPPGMTRANAPEEKDSVRCLNNALESENEGLDWETEYWLSRAVWWERMERMEAGNPDLRAAVYASSIRNFCG